MKTRLLLSIALFLAASVLSAEELLYRSNMFGMMLERIAPYRKDESEWILSIQRSTGGEVRSLFDRGKEVKRWEVSSAAGQTVERELDAGVLSARRVYDRTGSMIQEEKYDAGSLVQKTLFTYSEGRLTRARALAPDGSALYTDDYVYATNGSLRSVRRAGGASGPQQSSLVAGSAGVSEERDVAGDTVLLSRFDAKGRVTSQEKRTGGVTVSREDFVFRADSGTLATSSMTLPEQGTLIDRRYDDEGRLATETTTDKNGTSTVVSWVRDAQGRVLSQASRGPAGLELWTYTLKDDGSVSREEYYRRGTLEKVTIYGEGKARTEELYQDGDLFLRAFYEGDTKVKEEVWSDGTVLRTRSYP